jgi:geranylgeranyl reductase family protein
MKASYDVIVAGAGMAGSAAAAAAAKSGLSVALIDRNIEQEVGKKTNWGWVCGNAVAATHLDFVQSKLGVSFGQPELELKVDSVTALSPDMNYRYAFDGEGYVLDRPAFERKLLSIAIKAGAEFVPQFEVEGPVIEGSSVAGLYGKDSKKSHVEMRSKIVIDALGMATTLRRKLPVNPYVDRDVDISDIESTGRYIYEFDPDHEDLNYFDQKKALVHLNQNIAPGGYGWVFPQGKNKVNIGIGVQKQSLDIRNAKLGRKDTLHTLMDDYVKSNPVLKNLRLSNKDNNGMGYWSVGVRRQMPSLVFNGYMGAGDSMMMANPLSAGGIGPSLTAGILAGENAARAIADNDLSVAGLWKYNVDFVNAYGGKTAGLEVLRVYLQSLNNELIDYGMKNFLTTQEAVDLSYGRVSKLSLSSKLKFAVKGASNIKAFSDLIYVVKKMMFLNEVYKRYPGSPEGFEKWRATADKEIDETKARFAPNPV